MENMYAEQAKESVILQWYTGYSCKNNIKYAGYFYDAETGLYYLNARFYDPETARFIQQDSYSGNILDPLSLNLYTYAQNNPISYYDPTGHSIKSLLKKAKDTVNKVVSTVKAAVTVAKPVVKQAVKTAATVAVNTTVKKVTTPIANTIKAAANKTENQRAAFQTVLAVGKSVQSPVVNAWANYSQGEYDTLAGQIDGFMQFNDNPAQTVGDSINYFLSDPLRNNPVYGVYQYGKDFKKAVAENDWNTASYKLGVGVINTAEVAASVAIGGKIGGKIPSGKVSVPKVNALSKIGNAIDNFGAPKLAGANGMVISGAVPAEASVSSVSAGALGVRAGAVAGGTMAAGGVVYASKNSGQSSGGGNLSKKTADTEVILPSKPHRNGTEGHWETILDEVEIMKNSGNYKKIYVNKGLSKEIPGAKPNRRPDIMGVRNDGIIDQVEVPSKTDDILALRKRMQDNRKIIGERAGNIKIREISK